MLRLLFGAAVSVLLSGCAGEPFVYHSQNEIPEGPGVFSRDWGAFASEAESGEEHQVDVRAAAPEPDRRIETVTNLELFEEFQVFQRWKEVNQDSDAYREFQEWRQWRAYHACRKKGSSTAKSCATLVLD